MISFKSVGGISEGDMYRERSSKANSEKDKFFHFDSQSRGNEGISSGMKRPPSAARPFKTTSSNESCRYLAVVSTSIASIDYSLRRNLPTLRGIVEKVCESYLWVPLVQWEALLVGTAKPTGFFESDIILERFEEQSRTCQS